jgi:hypothetical protein
MTKIISLACYSIKIRERYNSDSEVISNFGGGQDLFDFCLNLLTDLKKKTSNDKQFQHVVRVKKLTDERRQIFGIIQTGDYGQESELLDVDTEKVAYERRTNHANMLPFYFLFDLPSGSNTGILLLQRMGMFGIRKMLFRVLSDKFESQHGDFTIRLDPLVDEKEIAKFQKGKVESIRFISFDIPSDITDGFDSGHTEHVGRAELIIRAKRGGFLPVSRMLRKFFAGGVEIPQLIALDETNFKYQDVKVRSRVGRSIRTVDLRNLSKLRSYYDITDEVAVDRSGHPKFTSIHEIAEDMVVRLRKGLGLGDE